jgi:predicted secreted hydrolase
MRRRRSVHAFALLAAGLIVAGCAGDPILANDPADRPSPPTPSATPSRPADPIPVELPRDDGPHDRLTEWWYYTGHLRDAEGAWYGFEYVIFRAERGSFPVAWASHLAITDEERARFVYGQRSEIGPLVQQAGPGFSLSLRGVEPADPATLGRPAWTMAGGGGTDRLAAVATPTEAASTLSPAGFGLELDLVSTKPAVLHDTHGWIDFGPAGGSYYYSRTRMSATGSLTLDGRVRPVEGSAWFDHQWGDFIAVGGGGWDWFAVNLDDGRDLTISLVRDRDGSYPLVYGTLVAADGRASHLPAAAVSVASTGEWTSPRTGAVYPAGWQVEVPSVGLSLAIEPTVADQELDTRATTGVIYWEGSQSVSGTAGGRPVTGRGYVELTGYAPSLTD